MKKGFTIALVALVALAFAHSANAVPALQVVIMGGGFDTADQSWITDNPNFTLRVVAAFPGGSADPPRDVWLAVTTLMGEAGSIMITDGGALAPAAFPLAVPSGLANHSVVGDPGYVTNYYNIGDFNPLYQVRDYNYDDMGNPGPLSNMGEYRDLSVAISGFSFAHFDALGPDASGDVKFSPFSHDSEFVPEPGTLSLLGAGLLGLVPALRRKRKKVK